MSKNDLFFRASTPHFVNKETAVQEDITERLENVLCDREPFTADHAECICRLTNEAAKEIEQLRDKLRERASLERAGSRFEHDAEWKR